MEGEQEVCQNCKAVGTLQEKESDYVCSECGAVSAEPVINTGKSWRDFDTETGHTDKGFAEKV